MPHRNDVCMFSLSLTPYEIPSGVTIWGPQGPSLKGGADLADKYVQ